MSMAAVKNLIFDLGNVLYDIDFNIMNQAFASIGIEGFDQHFTLNKSHQLFLDLEMGLIKEAAFYDGVRALANLPLTDVQIKFAWNALLVGFRKNSIHWIKDNNTKYNTFLYSNTNQIHHDHFIAEFENKVVNYPFVSLFKKPYYSHEMGMRKPEPASFTYILEKEGLLPAETLFIDDNEPNIIAAASVGLKVFHLKEGMRIEKDIATYL
jgi:putative hydrolase of the HAD superfamily